MKHVNIRPEDELPADQLASLMRRRLLSTQREELGRYVIREDDTTVYKPDGSILLVLVKKCIPEDIQKQAWVELSRVKGDASNRADIIDKDARMQRIRKDGRVSKRVAVPKSVLKAAGGFADHLGYYDFLDDRNRKLVKPAPTAWTLRNKGRAYLESLPLIYRVDKMYREHLPKERAVQMSFANRIPARFRIGDTAFTTVYVIKDLPTAVHTDKGDLGTGEGFGVMCTLGCYMGGAICFPRYRAIVQYKPGDLLFADVHEAHGNFPMVEGERICCVFHVRKRLVNQDVPKASGASA
jgi:hypothetical protein